jgi:glutamate decarboxylase
MVQLAQVPTDSEVASVAQGLKSVQLSYGADDDDTYSATVYGSRYAAADLPKHEMPDREMPKEVYVQPLASWK